jgi:hypothetical protein
MAMIFYIAVSEETPNNLVGNQDEKKGARMWLVDISVAFNSTELMTVNQQNSS